MKQLFQNPKEKSIEVVDLPSPAVQPGHMLVRNACSAVSPGTERGTVSAARDSYLKTARARPDLVKRVVDLVKRDGVMSAYKAVQTKLGEPQALGYSSAGTVIAVGEGCGDWFRVGDRVACAGQNVASHAEIVCVPVNLAAKIPEEVSFEEACFATLGAIALHGVRQGEPRLGERWAVIGLGIIGLLSVQYLVANGCQVAAFDLDPELVAQALALGADVGVAGGTSDQVACATAWSDGVGVDGVLVTAASSSEEPMISAAGMCRDRGRVVAVGFVPFGLPRTVAYAKELDLRISRSYGPGRYDRGFEEKGLDYPMGYVRWTQTRNLETYLQLLKTRQLQVAPLITHSYPIERAAEAYDALMSPDQQILGMVLTYGDAPVHARAERADQRAGRATATRPTPAAVRGKVGVAFIGAGSFARGTLLPAFAALEGQVDMRRVVTARGLSAHDAQRKFGFQHVGTDAQEVFDDPSVDLVCVATRHDLHAELVIKALQAGKHVFVEKPLALNEAQLQEVEAAWAASPGALLTGFNRRFSPMAQAIRGAIVGRGPAMMTYRVNAGSLPATHWLLDPDVGGGRMIGEGCHFIDFLAFLCGDAPLVSVQAECLGRSAGTSQDVAVMLKFEDGSVGQILYASQGHSGLGKERVEVFCGGVSAALDNYVSCTIYKGEKPQQVREKGKGHREEIRDFVAALRAGSGAPIPMASQIATTRASFAVHQALAEQSRILLG